MSKVKRNIMTIGIAASMLLTPSQILAQNNTFNLVEQNDYQDNPIEIQNEINSLLPQVVKILAKPILNAIGKIPLANNPGDVWDLGGGDYYVTYGSIDFNSGSIKTTVEKDLLVYGQDILRPYMQKNQILAGNVSMRIYKGTTKVADELRGSGRTFDYKIPGGYNTEYSDYRIEYTVSEKERWEPRMYYLNINPPCIPCETTSIGKEKGEDFSTNTLSNVVMKDNQIYIKQTDYTTPPTSQQSISNSLTMNGLFAEFYDNKTKELTNQTKSLSPGSKVNIKDVIVDLNYNKDRGYTEFKFNSEYHGVDYHYAYFKGDLTNEYKMGDELELIFKLVETAQINGNTFVELDYNIEAEKSGEYPSINSYLK